MRTKLTMMMAITPERERVILLRLFMAVTGKSSPSTPVNFLNHPTAENQRIYSVSLNKL